jgi:hypothetical protein
LKRWNLLLTLLIAGVLLLPSAAIGAVAEACCGVDVRDLTVTDDPDPVCPGETVTISGEYIAFSPWGPWTELYDTGANITIYDSSMNLVANFDLLLGEDQPDPGDFPPGTVWPFSQDWSTTVGGTYTYEVVAWSETSWGRMEISIVGETITVKEDCTPPRVRCVETVNPHGNNIPGSKRPASAPGRNPDGFYQLIARDNLDPEPKIFVSCRECKGLYPGILPFGPFMSGVNVKFTEAPGAIPSMKKMGSDKGQAGAVKWHITLPAEPVIIAVDASGNSAFFPCFVPPPPK